MDLNKDLKDIDSILAQRGVPIHARPIQAIMEFGKKHKISLPVVSSKFPQEMLPYPKENEEYTNYIHEWYKNVYGDRLKFDFSPGKVVLLIQDAPWQMNIPLVYGVIAPIIDISLENKKSGGLFSKGLQEFNILTCIQNITKDFAGRLSTLELKYIYKRFMVSLDVCHDLKKKFGAQYIRQAHADLLASVEHIMRSKPDFGQSRWSSLQFCEKYVKALLVSQRIDVPNIHKLVKLLKLLPNIDISNYFVHIEKVQCSASLRYGEESTELKQAIEAHENAIDLISKLKNFWANK